MFYCLGRQQLKGDQRNQRTYHIESSQSKLREPQVTARCNRSSGQYDGKKQGGRRIVATHIGVSKDE